MYNGPKFLSTCRVLARHDDFRNSQPCERLFKSMLKISNANWRHTLDQIILETSAGTNARETQAPMADMYRFLQSGGDEDVDWKHIRYAQK